MKKLYYNGQILTMESSALSTSAEWGTARRSAIPEALLTEDDRILAVGSFEELRLKAAPEVEMQDLKGHTLMPSFIDAHGHFAAAANAILQCPLGEAYSFEELQERLYAFARNVPPGEWVQGQGYDHNQLAEKRHPDRRILDEVCPDQPLVITHKSGHMGVFNTKALEVLGVLEGDLPQVDGGRIEMEEGLPTGYMEEEAFLHYQKRIPMGDPEDFAKAFQKVQEMYASYGITTVQEGMFVGQLTPIYRNLLETESLKLDLVAYLDAQTASEIRGQFPKADRRYQGHFKIGGYKIFLDGSPQGRTAWLREPYIAEGGEQEGYCGYPMMSNEEVEAALRKAVEEQMPILAHCNGDAAARQYIDAVEKISREYPEMYDLHPVMIHAQMLPAEEMERVHSLGIIPSFFIAHIYHWGDVHVKNLGIERAQKISPAGSALKAGIPFTFHQDTPVIPPDMLETVWCAAVRRTKNGLILGEEERIGIWDALQAVTIHAAAQYGEEEEKGTLAEGKKADMVILDQNPLLAGAEALRSIQVLETIKDGKTIWMKNPATL